MAVHPPTVSAEAVSGNMKRKMTPIDAATLLLRLAFPAYTTHFKSPNYMRPSTLSLLEKRVLKRTLHSTSVPPAYGAMTAGKSAGRRELDPAEVRWAIGTDVRYWRDFAGLLRAAIPSLERRSFALWDPEGGVDYDTPSGTLISSNYPGLYHDLQTLHTLLCISRNVLTVGAAGQNLAANEAVEEEVMRVIRCCVRVGARGFDGPSERREGDGDLDGKEGASGDTARATEEEKWAHIVGAYKRVLIAGLQWLNNFVAKNERMKTSLFVKLFDESSTPVYEAGPTRPAAFEWTSAPEPPITENDALLAFGFDPQSRKPLNTDGAISIADQGDDPHLGYDTKTGAPPPEWVPLPTFVQKAINEYKTSNKRHLFSVDFLTSDVGAYIWYTKQQLPEIRQQFSQRYSRQPTAAELFRNRSRRRSWMRNEAEKQSWIKAYDLAWHIYRDDILAYNNAQAMKEANTGTEEEKWERWVRALEHRFYQIDAGFEASNQALADQDPSTAKQHQVTSERVDGDRLASVADLAMPFTAAAGKKILESGKLELMKRLEGYDHSPEESAHTPRPVYPLSITPSAADVAAKTFSGLDEHGRSTFVRSASGSRMIPFRPPPAPAAHFPQTASTEHVMDEESEVDSEDRAYNPNDHDPGSHSEHMSGDDGEDEDGASLPSLAASTEDGRGLLTDVPLILGPSEIEVLPMLVMSCCVPAPLGTCPAPTSDADETRRLSALRTRILLSTLPGRNLLRELLIFVAAWDLHTHELYFSFITKIIESVVKTGMGAYAYWVLRDRSRSRDIISPAQGVVVKVLGSIYRQRTEGAKSLGSQAKVDTALAQSSKGNINPSDAAESETMQRNRTAHLHAVLPSIQDLETIQHLFLSFRQHVIPQTCALLHLQSLIHSGRAQAEDFPLNLWDMERMYEGVYGVVEMWGVLSEDSRHALNLEAEDDETMKLMVNGQEGVTWKDILSEWELASELVTLLRELDHGIPRQSVFADLQNALSRAGSVTQHSAALSSVGTSVSAAQRPVYYATNQTSPPNPHVAIPQHATPVTLPPVAVEKPYVVESNVTLPPLPSAARLAVATGQEPIFEPETPLAYPDTPSHSTNHTYVTQPESALTYTSAESYPDNGSISYDDDLEPSGGPPTQDEPSDFEWRNLKKLTVLVLSSLVWKNRKVQKQVRECGGLEALVRCCGEGYYSTSEQQRNHAAQAGTPLRYSAGRDDENNIGLRDHAVMCLRFAVEGCEENANYVRELAGAVPSADGRMAFPQHTHASHHHLSQSFPPRSVPNPRRASEGAARRPLTLAGLSEESLAASGFETFVDEKGRMKLRRAASGDNEQCDRKGHGTYQPPVAPGGVTVPSNAPSR